MLDRVLASSYTVHSPGEIESKQIKNGTKEKCYIT